MLILLLWLRFHHPARFARLFAIGTKSVTVRVRVSLKRRHTQQIFSFIRCLRMRLPTAAQRRAKDKSIGYLVLPGVRNGLLSYNGRVYRGAIWLMPVKTATETSFQAINLVDLEDYLLSVVPSEMPTSWHLEARKAQSIAARSMPLPPTIGRMRESNYDLKDTTDDQVYLECGKRDGDRQSGL